MVYTQAAIHYHYGFSMAEIITDMLNNGGQICFENANLSGAKLSGVNFLGANLNGAILVDADLSHADLSNAQLVAANLQNANLQSANLTNANFRKADLRGAQLDFATLTGANFEYAELMNASFNHLPAAESYDQLKKMAFYDLITGVYNRQAFEEFFQKELVNMWRYKYSSALFLIDLDHFKEVNDTHGHLIGDTLLKEVATRLKKLIRQGDLISRFGGDEFALYFKNIQNEVDSGHIAKKIIESVSAPFFFDQISAKIGVSVGIYYWRSDSDSQVKLRDIISRADTALYSAKSNGRNCYQYYSK